MVGLADENGKEYECKYGTYSKENRFMFNDEAGEVFKNKGYRGLFDILVHEDLWKLKQEPVKEMSLQDIEKELGYRVRIIDPKPGKEVSEKRRKEVDDTIDFLERMLGLGYINREDYY